MSEFLKMLQGMFSKPYYPQDRFLREKLSFKQKFEKKFSDVKDKINELVFGETKSEDIPYVYIDIEETYVRKLTGVRYTGEEKEPEPNMFEVIHEKESAFLLGIVPGKPPYPATSPLPDLSSDRPYFPEDPDSDSETKTKRSSGEKKKRKKAKRSRLAPLPEDALSVE